MAHIRKYLNKLDRCVTVLNTTLTRLHTVVHLMPCSVYSPSINVHEDDSY